MRTASTSEQLANAIESLIASYIDEVRQAAQHAVERSLSRAMAAVDLTRFRRHPVKHENVRGVSDGETKETEVHDGIQSRCSAPVRARRGVDHAGGE
jgi:hypothetical protein